MLVLYSDMMSDNEPLVNSLLVFEVGMDRTLHKP